MIYLHATCPGEKPLKSALFFQTMMHTCRPYVSPHIRHAHRLNNPTRASVFFFSKSPYRHNCSRENRALQLLASVQLINFF